MSTSFLEAAERRASTAAANIGRVPLSAANWREVYIDPARAGLSASTAESVCMGNSLLLLDSLASASECQALLEEAAASADDAFEAQTRPSAKYGATPPARVRMELVDHFDEHTIALCDLLLRRAVSRLGKELPSVVERQLGLGLGEGFASMRPGIGSMLGFSDGEPAINVYRAGGLFKPHEDKQSLTVLVPLSDALNGAFVGGGTAFWTTEQRSTASTTPPGSVVHAPAGTAIVFTGTVTHAALATLSGERTILVASFSSLSHGIVGAHVT